MVQTSDFKTKNEIVYKTMPRINGNNQFKSKTILAIDGGYSGVKVVSPNKLAAFPSYAKKVDKTFSIIGKMDSDDLLFRNNKTGEIWVVGKTAENLMDRSDVDEMDDDSLYTRYRYNSDIYKVIMATGIALGLYKVGTVMELYLQTGLPSEYLAKDTAKLKAALSGNYDISLKIGNNDWETFQFDLYETHIEVMEQPKGTLNNLVYNMGKVSKEWASVLSSNVIIWDIGFGTEDIFAFKKASLTGNDTFRNSAMRSVFERTIDKVRENNKDMEIDVKVFELQKYLTDGEIPIVDEETYESTYIRFEKELEEANKEICMESIDRLMKKYDSLKDYRYLVVTGGTGESRFEMIKDRLKGLGKLTILAGNENIPEVSCIYSNVLGYYMFRYAKLMSEMKKAGFTPEEE